MVKQKSQAKAMGRPSLSGEASPGERSPLVALRMPPGELDAIDALAEREGLKRSAMIRRLLLAGLETYKPVRTRR